MHTRLAAALTILSSSTLLACGGDADSGLYYPNAPAARGAADDGPEAGDQYEPVGTNPFVVVDHDPLSTFATDVDTASYDIFRRDLGERGQLPDPDSVRLEEFVNAFGYDYPAPAWDAVSPFTLDLEAAAVPALGTTLLRVGLRAKDLAPDERPPANLVFLVDVSGSMDADNKIPLVRVVLRELVDTLRPTDRVAIVTYASQEQTRLASTPVSERAKILSVIDGLLAGGSTAGHAGMEMAYAQAEDNLIDGGVNHVILCTDGDFNVGISDTDDLVAYIETKRERGVTLTALGFGYGNLNDGMMERVTNAGNGSYAVITDEDHAVQYAHRDLWRTIFLVSRDTKIQVAFNADHVRAYRLLGYDNRALADDQFMDDAVDAGEVGAGHRVTALYELVLGDDPIPAPAGAPALEDGPPDPEADVPELDPADLVLVRVRYRSADPADEAPAEEIDATLGAEAVRASLDGASGDTQFAWAIAGFAELLKGSPFAERYTIATLRARLADHTEGASDREELLRLFDAAAALLPEAGEG